MEALRAMKFMRAKQGEDEFANVVQRVPVENQDIPIPEGFQKLTVPQKSDNARVLSGQEPEITEKKNISVKPRKNHPGSSRPAFEIPIQNSTESTGDRIRITYDRSLNEKYHTKARQKYGSSTLSKEIE